MKYEKILLKVLVGGLGTVVLVAAYWAYEYTSLTGRSIFEPIIKESKVCSSIPGNNYCSTIKCKRGYVVMIPGGARCYNGFYSVDGE